MRNTNCAVQWIVGWLGGSTLHLLLTNFPFNTLAFIPSQQKWIQIKSKFTNETLWGLRIWKPPKLFQFNLFKHVNMFPVSSRTPQSFKRSRKFSSNLENIAVYWFMALPKSYGPPSPEFKWFSWESPETRHLRLCPGSMQIELWFRQACSSQCNLDSRVGRRQCCLLWLDLRPLQRQIKRYLSSAMDFPCD